MPSYTFRVEVLLDSQWELIKSELTRDQAERLFTQTQQVGEKPRCFCVDTDGTKTIQNWD